MNKKIIGKWIVENGKVIENQECVDIKNLTETELEQIATREGGWVKLYKNKNTGEYWELDYPQSELQGGGPPTLEQVEAGEVQKRYGTLP
jgi:hypothetical protein